ncbi:MAG: tetratricopeptide repeat protein [Chthoniobacterales bacterium]
MAPESESNLRLEIGHVLFIDLVGYSKLLIEEQKERLRQLTEIVLATAQVAKSTNEQLVRLPTGDGMALVFRNSSEEPVHCALEIAKALKSHPDVLVRMGIHSGPVSEVTDVSGRTNIAGAGINMAQRVMDCGDAGHILLSQRVADDLGQYRQWSSRLHPLGECEVKHGIRLQVVNLYTEELGNPTIPARFKKTKDAKGPGTKESKKTDVPRGGATPRPQTMRWVGMVALILILTGVSIWLFRFRQSVTPRRQEAVPPGPATAPGTSAPEKSIAVLPFENLSSDKENAYFADGVQDEILTDLAQIADLKVISRSSVMQYRNGVARNLRDIGRQLGVSHLLEGSVQRAGGKVRVNAQLIDTRTDAHLWAQTYDRNLADIFTIQSEIARSIAQQLQAKLAPDEKTRLATRPTENSEAYLLYLQANELVYVAASRQEAIDADKAYAQAIALDPGFALARARASMLNSLMYSIGRLPERKTRARALADEALQLAPNLGEAHLALGLCYYRIDADYDRALKELAIARAAAPNDSKILDSSGYIYRRQGRWREALAAFAQARELDPRQAHFDGAASTLRLLRQWPAASAAYKHGLQLEPQLLDGWTGLAYVEFAQSGSPAPACATLDRLSDTMKGKGAIAQKWDYAMMARDFSAAKAMLPDIPVNDFPGIDARAFYEGCVAFARRDLAGARNAFEQIRPEYESAARDHPDDPTFHAALGKLYALLGRKDDAVREARHATELCPENKDAVDGPLYAANLAFVYAQSGEVEPAITLLSHLLTTPGADRITLAHLRLSWEWDPLRQDPRFQALIKGSELETVYN